MIVTSTLRSELLAGQVAVVTGAAQGIGRAVAETLAANGAQVCLVDVDADKVAEAAQGLESVTSFSGDLVDPAIPQQAVQHTVDTFGRLDIVVNAAGYTWDAVIHKMTDEQFQAMLDIHAVAPFRMCRAAAPYLREPAKHEAAQGIEHFRKVVNVSAIAASFGVAGGANYATGKAAVIGLTKSLAVEWGRYKINANAVAFGAIQTRFGAPHSAAYTVHAGGRELPVGFADKTLAAANVPIDHDPDMLYQPRPSAALLARTGTVGEAADTVLWLASPLSNYVTGQVITCSGGERGGLA
jgi:3-oxoacyl-[acyl-carrier protein] reductase